ncbi:glycosyltransferase family 4 protein, partial [Neobacillus mesonae]|uniref:glycosyltransferase family 4 protein n=1 Tax=Neobacillus mesonae TaxID=1193713 RepID=UPI002E22C17F|nr:glycosyltransferase family 4 protein [Neobacillus mesonae]
MDNLDKLSIDIPYFLDISNCLGKFDRFFYFRRNRKLLLDVEKLYDMNDFSYTLAYSLFSNGYLAYSLYRKYNIPYIVIVQNTDVNMYFKKVIFLRNMGREILKNASKIVFLSQPYKEFVINKYVKSSDVSIIQQKSVVIPFGIDDFWFENIYFGKKQANNKEIKLLFVGRVNENKNVESIVKASKKLMQKGYRITLTIVGDIEDKNIGSQLRQYKFINYIPYVDKRKLLQIYRQSDIFIMPSIKESFGLVYAEAMSQGLPVIYTRGQGFDKHFK